jgi:hypothetical protein
MGMSSSFPMSGGPIFSRTNGKRKEGLFYAPSFLLDAKVPESPWRHHLSGQQPKRNNGSRRTTTFSQGSELYILDEEDRKEGRGLLPKQKNSHYSNNIIPFFEKLIVFLQAC